MISTIMSSALVFLSIIGPHDSTVSIENDNSNVEYNINVVDSETIKVDEYFFSASDFSIPEDMISEENIDTLSEVIIWDSNTGEQVAYDSMTYTEDTVTYFFEDESITVGYETINPTDNVINDLTGIIISSASTNGFKIIITTISILVIILIILLIIKNIFARTIKNIFKILT